MENKIDKMRKIIKITCMFSFLILVIIFLIYSSSKNIPDIPGILVLLTGSLLNLVCVITNNWKMPTYYGKNDYIHTRYKNRKNINLWVLSDFMHLFIPIFKIDIIFSLGDILIVIGISNIFLSMFQ